MTTYNDDNEYSVEINSEVYNQDYDDVCSEEQNIEKEETDIQFE